MKHFVMCFLLLQIFLMTACQKRQAPVQVNPDQMRVLEHLGSTIDIHGLEFQNELGQPVKLAHYFKKNRPVILALVYYRCPHLCTLVLNGLMDSLKGFDWKVGRSFDVVAVSIDPRETPSLAQEKKKAYLQAYAQPEAEKGWHFLVGKEDQIQKLAQSVGFQYVYDASDQQYAHSAVLFILTPEGKIARYLYGIHFDSKQLRLSLLEASSGKIGTVVDRVLLFCFHFDPTKNSYTFQVWKVVQLLLGLQAFMVLIGLWLLWKKDRPSKALPKARDED